jgi:hypothetical protein
MSNLCVYFIVARGSVVGLEENCRDNALLFGSTTHWK